MNIFIYYILVEGGQFMRVSPYFLSSHSSFVLDSVQPRYAEKYLNGKKYVDTSPTSVVEFICPSELIQALFAIQHKPEDGAISMGLGNKAGKGLPLFNTALAEGRSRWRIVRVKRSAKEKGKR